MSDIPSTPTHCAHVYNYQPVPPLRTPLPPGGRVQRIPRSSRGSRFSPYRKASTRYTSRNSVSSSPSVDDSSPMSDDDENEQSEDERGEATQTEGTKIPKPKGGFGKPNCGGYSIQKEAGWDRETYAAIRVSFLPSTRAPMHSQGLRKSIRG